MTNESKYDSLLRTLKRAYIVILALTGLLLFQFTLSPSFAEHGIDGCEFNDHEPASRALSEQIVIYRAGNHKIDPTTDLNKYKDRYTKSSANLLINEEYADNTFWARGEERTTFRFAFLMPDGAPLLTKKDSIPFQDPNEVHGIFHGNIWFDLERTMLATRPIDPDPFKPLLFRESGAKNPETGLTPIIYEYNKNDILVDMNNIDNNTGEIKSYYYAKDADSITNYLYCKTNTPGRLCTLYGMYNGNQYELSFRMDTIPYWRRADDLAKKLLDCVIN